MAQVPPLSGPSQPRSVGSQGPSREQKSIGDLASLLGQHGAGPGSADLALDLLLHEIVTQACLATGATGAAVAMERDGAFVCRATTGINAPDLGSHLSTSSGLSGMCVRTRQPRRCDDASTDPRVDAAACWRLGVQSLLVVPVLRAREVIGVFEIFSPLTNAFDEGHERALLALSQRITDTLDDSAGSPTETGRDVAALLDEAGMSSPEVAPPLFTGGQQPRQIRDYWTPVLTVLVVALSLLLGWMIGRTGWLRAGRSTVAPSASVALPAVAADAKPVPLEAPPAAAPSTASPQAGSAVPAKPKAIPGGLVVYESGKLVFEMKPSPGAARGVELAARKSKANPGPVQVTPEVAAGYLINRIEPHYPDQARQQHIQGAVVLQARIGKDGAVQKLTALEGDPQLALAAADAVRQWRFRPYAPQGRPADFETQITVNFALP